jgi:hypothetical protein
VTHLRLAFKLFFSFCFLFLLAANATAQESELEARARMKTEYIGLFQQSKFADLDRTATGLRDPKARMPSGGWKLSVFYDTFASHLKTQAVLAATSEEGLQKVEAQWVEHERKLNVWKEQFPDSATPYLLLAQLYRNRGFGKRGGGLAWTVGSEQWETFRKLLAKARESLQSSPKTKLDPHWYSIMLDVAGLQSDDKLFYATLEELSKNAPNYHWAWFTAVNFLQPKWGGSYEAVEKLVGSAVAANQAGNLDGKAMYARIYWSLSADMGKANLFLNSRVSWPKMNEGFQEMLKQYPDDWNLNNYALFACYAGDAATLSKLLTKIGSKPNEDAWGNSTIYDRCRNRAEGGAAPR